MKTLKYIGQILGVLIYTPIYTGVMYAAIVLPMTWVVTRSTKAMILILIFLGGIIEGIIALLQVFGLVPLHFLTRNNRIANYIAMGLCAILPALNIYSLWHVLLPYGALGIVMAVIFSGMLLQFIIVSIVGIMQEQND